MKKGESLVIEGKHEVYGICRNSGTFSSKGESTIKIEPYKYTEAELNVHFAKGALDAFLELNAKYKNYEDIQELNVKVFCVERIKENGERTNKLQAHLKKL
jgi:hypothetical protein